jgi:hypothetical protein
MLILRQYNHSGTGVNARTLFTRHRARAQRLGAGRTGAIEARILLW